MTAYRQPKLQKGDWVSWVDKDTGKAHRGRVQRRVWGEVHIEYAESIAQGLGHGCVILPRDFEESQLRKLGEQ